MVLRYDDYKLFLRDWMAALPTKGHGEINRLAQFLNISSSLVSTILNTSRHFSSEQACDLCEYIGLKKTEAEYFIALVSLEKAGSVKLQNFWREQKKRLRLDATKIHSRIEFEKVLSEEDQARYYSHAMYSQIRVLATLDGGVSLETIAGVVKSPQHQIHEVIDFLLEKGLIKKTNGNFFSTEQVIHVSRESVNYRRHHVNWRLQQINQLTDHTDSGVTFTFPCTLNQEDFLKIKNILMEAITQTHKIVRASPAEEMACLTIDLIKYSDFKKD